MFTYFALGALAWREFAPGAWLEQRAPYFTFGAVLVTLMIGLRYHVGADWISYEFMFDYAHGVPLERMLRIGDPAFQLLNWTVQALDFELWVVNLACGAIFTWGMSRFARAQSNPWLAMLVAVPYLIIVVAMGYTRQSVAIGITMAGLAMLIRGGSILRFAVYVFVAALFHKTAVVVLSLVLLASGRNRAFNLIAGTFAFILMYNFFLADSVDVFVRNYIQTRYASQGAAIRVAMIVGPALLYLAMHRKFEFADQEARLWRYFSLGALACLLALVLVPSSTAVDRIALYFLPLQIAIFARVPRLTATPGVGTAAVMIGAFAVQFVWLNYAVHARFWVPYQFYPLG